ncbi:MAG: GNAT family N-acetyltransferase [Aquincola tertiaricarbonis]
MNAMSLPARRQRLISWPAMDCVQPTGGCSDSWQRSRYRERVLLRDGRSVLLRPAHHRDAALLQRFVAELSPRSRLLRFHGVVKGLSDAMARTLSTQVASRHVALVALADGPDGLPELCAEARYAVSADLRSNEAEVGVAVADDWQHMGLGHTLLTRLAMHARANGLLVLRGYVMAGNEPILALLRALGDEPRGHAAEIRATITR